MTDTFAVHGRQTYAVGRAFQTDIRKQRQAGKPDLQEARRQASKLDAQRTNKGEKPGRRACPILQRRRYSVGGTRSSDPLRIGALKMSVITPVTPTRSGTLTPSAIYRMTVDEFERIAGSLDDDHVELIDGYIVGRAEMKPSHALAAELLKHSLGLILPAGFHLREDKPVRIPELNEPRPDFSLVRGDPWVYAMRHPGPLDVLLVVEISDTTLQRDRGEQLLSYGRSGIPVYWIVNLVDHQVEI
jgi:Uma2 family endonuclease